MDDWKQLPKSLTFLDLSENSIEDAEPLLTVFTADCPNLQHFSLMHNSIKRVPATLGLLQDHCPHLVTLNVKGNPQRGIPSHVLDYDCSTFLTYLTNRLTLEQRSDAVGKIQARQSSAEKTRNKSTCNANREEKKVEEVENKSLSLSTPPAAAAAAPQQPDQDAMAESSSDLQLELKRKVAKLETQLENLSLSQAKRYALKKSLAMERSKLIREERRLGIQNCELSILSSPRDFFQNIDPA